MCIYIYVYNTFQTICALICHSNIWSEIVRFSRSQVRLQICRDITLQQGQGVVLRQGSAWNQAVNLQGQGHQEMDGFWTPKRSEVFYDDYMCLFVANINISIDQQVIPDLFIHA